MTAAHTEDQAGDNGAQVRAATTMDAPSGTTPLSAWLPEHRGCAHIADDAPSGDDATALALPHTPGHIAQLRPLIAEILPEALSDRIEHIWHHPGQRALVVRAPGTMPTRRPHGYPTPHAPTTNALGPDTTIVAVPLYIDPGRATPNSSAAARAHLRSVLGHDPAPEDAFAYAVSMATGAPAAHADPEGGMLTATLDRHLCEDLIACGRTLCNAWYGHIGRGPARWTGGQPRGPIEAARFMADSAALELGASRILNVSARVWRARIGNENLAQEWLRRMTSRKRVWTERRARAVLTTLGRIHRLVEIAEGAALLWQRAADGPARAIEGEGRTHPPCTHTDQHDRTRP